MKKNKNTVPFSCLAEGKLYDTVDKRLAAKPLYVNPFDDYCGYLEVDDIFVVLERVYKGPFHWTKILTSSGVVGWIPWDNTRRFKKANK